MDPKRLEAQSLATGWVATYFGCERTRLLLSSYSQTARITNRLLMRWVTHEATPSLAWAKRLLRVRCRMAREMGRVIR